MLLCVPHENEMKSETHDADPPINPKKLRILDTYTEHSHDNIEGVKCDRREYRWGGAGVDGMIAWRDEKCWEG